MENKSYEIKDHVWNELLVPTIDKTKVGEEIWSRIGDKVWNQIWLRTRGQIKLHIYENS